MRILKFRRWIKINGYFDYMGGYLNYLEIGDHIGIYQDFMAEDSNNGPIEQFTGLYDKNGTEIYEGDIVEHDRERYLKGEVKYWEGAFIVGAATTCNALVNYNVPNYVEVLGHIHDGKVSNY